eukprot:TRINITY_DN9579_c0_g1_i1.p1 TRINITY_DN9579_c0_g1~~TRINITY_DN9579_c0_g1_i1.p1  ORF type:complete len:432 (+),score=68.91 TRINITY_DN9579_c0_g1_i1:86-1381(+)
MDTPSVAAIIQSVESLWDEGLDLLKRMVSCPSTLGNEAEVQNLMEQEFKKLPDPCLKTQKVPILGKEIENRVGYSPVLDWSYFDKDPVKYAGKVNVIATRTPKTTTGKSLILNGHVDVVPVCCLDMWSADPFDPVVKDGRLYGRGSGDMKAGIAAFVLAYKALLHLGYGPAAPFHMQTVIEEECTGNGTLHLSNKLKADAVIIPEPMESLVTAQLGVLWFQATVFGRPAHVLDTSSGINAILAAQELLSSLQSLESQYNLDASSDRVYSNHKHPVNFNVGKMNGGDWASSVPAWCTFECRVGFLPGVPISKVKSDIEACLKKAAEPRKIEYKILYNGFHAEGCVMDRDNLLFVNLAECHQIVTGKPAKYEAITCTTDARFFQLYEGIPSTCYGPEAKNIHGIDESVSLDSMKQVAKVLAVFISKWCGLEKL